MKEEERESARERKETIEGVELWGIIVSRAGTAAHSPASHIGQKV